MPNPDVEITCDICSHDGPMLHFVTTASQLIHALHMREYHKRDLRGQTIDKRIQAAENAMANATQLHLADDRWGDTRFAFFYLFRAGKAFIRRLDGSHLAVQDVIMQQWQEAGWGGWDVVDRDGIRIFRIRTWIS